MTSIASVDPTRVPQRRLSSGALMPAVGLGTFGSDHVTPAEVAGIVEGAIAAGYRHLDCASVYGNEREIGAVLARLFAAGTIKRSELWITSKLWNDKHAEADVIPSCRQTLADLRCDYLDSYLVHWPFPNYHPPGCTVESRSPDSKPFSAERFLATWRQMEKLVDLGLVRHIGTSNMTIPKFEAVWPHMRIKPAVNEMELHPHFQQPELFEYVRARGVEPIGYCPIGSPDRPERDKTPEDTSPTQDPVVRRIAEAHGLHPATLCVKWAVQRGQTPIPFSTKRRNFLANLECATTAPLSDQEMRELAALDRGCRLIKGQVFLWEGAKGWEDLWDVDGTITGN